MSQLSALSTEECMVLLASVPVGRVVFTERALPAIRPVNHLVDDGNVIIRTQLGTSVVSAAGRGIVVAYEADAIDAATRTGWSVVVTGVAQLVTDSDDLARYLDLLQPWIEGERNSVIRIPPDLVTGYQLVAAAAA
jgi:nitroimidazol reductase NimA-like FMN-containing flavoprotein (pyridoxamine 5'-phosphate oxidase superfamily)